MTFSLGMFPDNLWQEVLHQILTFIHSTAHYVGFAILNAIGIIFPSLALRDDLINPVDYLAVVTAFLILVQAARKAAWIIVLVGWVMISLRLILAVFGVL